MQEIELKRNIYTVSRLNREVNQLLQSGFPLIWLEGEISNLTRPSSGHLYFSLKDAQAQIRAAMFRNRTPYLGFKPQNGMEVRVRARIGLYEPRGDFQIIVEHIEEAGDGALRQAFEALKTRLSTEGLFNPERKKQLPELPHRIGVITSPTGAAIRDVLSVLKRRFPLIPILLYPVQVQGDAAVADINAALELADKRQDCDVLLLVRGGGSLEDLQAFNEERVARAITTCRIPIVTGIGHEIDFTIADFVADHRAATPSAAAECVTPSDREWLNNLNNLCKRLYSQLHTLTHDNHTRLTALNRHLKLLHPLQRLEHQTQRLDELENRLLKNGHQTITQKQHQYTRLSDQLNFHSPQRRLTELGNRHRYFSEKLQTLGQQQIIQQQQHLNHVMQTLDAVSPLATLQRGYAIVTQPLNQVLVTNHEQVKQEEVLLVQLAKGKLSVKVEKKHNR